jgi:DNA-binding cell septation regulator SpoVG
MEVTDVQISLTGCRRYVAFARITLSNCFVLRGLVVIKNADEYRIKMPWSATSDGTIHDLVEPTTDGAVENIRTAIIADYDNECLRCATEK